MYFFIANFNFFSPPCDRLSTDYDDGSISGGSYGGSYEDRDLSISPGTLAQFTWSGSANARRISGSSDEETNESAGTSCRRRLDSISEDDPVTGRMELDRMTLADHIDARNNCKYFYESKFSLTIYKEDP